MNRLMCNRIYECFIFVEEIVRQKRAGVKQIGVIDRMFNEVKMLFFTLYLSFFETPRKRRQDTIAPHSLPNPNSQWVGVTHATFESIPILFLSVGIDYDHVTEF